MTNKIKKILIANRGEIACRVIKTARKIGVAGLAAFTIAGCATSSSGGVPSLISSSKVESMSDTAWNDLTQSVGLSSNQGVSNRFETIASQVIGVSDLADENWDIKLLNGRTGIFSMPGNRLGASEGHIVTLSDDRLASMTAYAIASRELKHTETMISRQMWGSLTNDVFSLGSLGGKLDPKTAAIKSPLPPTVEMREKATARAEELVALSGFQVDFLISTSLLNLNGPVK